MCPLCAEVQAAHPGTVVTCHQAPREPEDHEGRHFLATRHYPRPGWTPDQECPSCASYDWRPRTLSRREEGGSILALAVVIVIVIVAVYCARHPHEPQQYPSPQPPLYPADRKTPRRK